ncbi:hypothetical protein [Variovorax ginsengisoli]|uniref:Uncharacterized protein n=1 Tax=Variovorax ginsengisoli TaxID=363844 RepID=A0ABT9SAI3_9BURK|nr:hypothetical protein [Variovorax ginsengisoli]MDP9900377.1 hypothetical protein [Variovorax ginsengisoli]
MDSKDWQGGAGIGLIDAHRFPEDNAKGIGRQPCAGPRPSHAGRRSLRAAAEGHHAA